MQFTEALRKLGGRSNEHRRVALSALTQHVCSGGALPEVAVASLLATLGGDGDGDGDGGGEDGGAPLNHSLQRLALTILRTAAHGANSDAGNDAGGRGGGGGARAIWARLLPRLIAILGDSNESNLELSLAAVGAIRAMPAGTLLRALGSGDQLKDALRGSVQDRGCAALRAAAAVCCCEAGARALLLLELGAAGAAHVTAVCAAAGEAASGASMWRADDAACPRFHTNAGLGIARGYSQSLHEDGEAATEHAADARGRVLELWLSAASLLDDGDAVVCATAAQALTALHLPLRCCGASLDERSDAGVGPVAGSASSTGAGGYRGRVRRLHCDVAGLRPRLQRLVARAGAAAAMGGGAGGVSLEAECEDAAVAAAASGALVWAGASAGAASVWGGIGGTLPLAADRAHGGPRDRCAHGWYMESAPLALRAASSVGGAAAAGGGAAGAGAGAGAEARTALVELVTLIVEGAMPMPTCPVALDATAAAGASGLSPALDSLGGVSPLWLGVPESAESGRGGGGVMSAFAQLLRPATVQTATQVGDIAASVDVACRWAAAALLPALGASGEGGMPIAGARGSGAGVVAGGAGTGAGATEALEPAVRFACATSLLRLCQCGNGASGDAGAGAGIGASRRRVWAAVALRSLLKLLPARGGGVAGAAPKPLPPPEFSDSEGEADAELDGNVDGGRDGEGEVEGEVEQDGGVSEDPLSSTAAAAAVRFHAAIGAHRTLRAASPFPGGAGSEIGASSSAASNSTSGVKPSHDSAASWATAGYATGGVGGRGELALHSAVAPWLLLAVSCLHSTDLLGAEPEGGYGVGEAAWDSGAVASASSASTPPAQALFLDDESKNTTLGCATAVIFTLGALSPCVRRIAACRRFALVLVSAAHTRVTRIATAAFAAAEKRAEQAERAGAFERRNAARTTDDDEQKARSESHQRSNVEVTDEQGASEALDSVLDAWDSAASGTGGGGDGGIGHMMRQHPARWPGAEAARSALAGCCATIPDGSGGADGGDMASTKWLLEWRLLLLAAVRGFCVAPLRRLAAQERRRRRRQQRRQQQSGDQELKQKAKASVLRKPAVGARLALAISILECAASAVGLGQGSGPWPWADSADASADANAGTGCSQRLLQDEYMTLLSAMCELLLPTTVDGAVRADADSAGGASVEKASGHMGEPGWDWQWARRRLSLLLASLLGSLCTHAERLLHAPAVHAAVGAVLEQEASQNESKYHFRCRQLARFYGVRGENEKAKRVDAILRQPFGAVARKMRRKYGTVPIGWEPALLPSECIDGDSAWDQGARYAEKRAEEMAISAMGGAAMEGTADADQVEPGMEAQAKADAAYDPCIGGWSQILRYPGEMSPASGSVSQDAASDGHVAALSAEGKHAAGLACSHSVAHGPMLHQLLVLLAMHLPMPTVPRRVSATRWSFDAPLHGTADPGQKSAKGAESTDAALASSTLMQLSIDELKIRLTAAGAAHTVPMCWEKSDFVEQLQIAEQAQQRQKMAQAAQAAQDAVQSGAGLVGFGPALPDSTSTLRRATTAAAADISGGDAALVPPAARLLAAMASTLLVAAGTGSADEGLANATAMRRRAASQSAVVEVGSMLGGTAAAAAVVAAHGSTAADTSTVSQGQVGCSAADAVTMAIAAGGGVADADLHGVKETAALAALRAIHILAARAANARPTQATDNMRENGESVLNAPLRLTLCQWLYDNEVAACAECRATRMARWLLLHGPLRCTTIPLQITATDSSPYNVSRRPSLMVPLEPSAATSQSSSLAALKSFSPSAAWTGAPTTSSQPPSPTALSSIFPPSVDAPGLSDEPTSERSARESQNGHLESATARLACAPPPGLGECWGAWGGTRLLGPTPRPSFRSFGALDCVSRRVLRPPRALRARRANNARDSPAQNVSLARALARQRSRTGSGGLGLRSPPPALGIRVGARSFDAASAARRGSDDSDVSSIVSSTATFDWDAESVRGGRAHSGGSSGWDGATETSGVVLAGGADSLVVRAAADGAEEEVAISGMRRTYRAALASAASNLACGRFAHTYLDNGHADRAVQRLPWPLITLSGSSDPLQLSATFELVKSSAAIVRPRGVGAAAARLGCEVVVRFQLLNFSTATFQSPRLRFGTLGSIELLRGVDESVGEGTATCGLQHSAGLERWFDASGDGLQNNVYMAFSPRCVVETEVRFWLRRFGTACVLPTVVVEGEVENDGDREVYDNSDDERDGFTGGIDEDAQGQGGGGDEQAERTLFSFRAEPLIIPLIAQLEPPSRPPALQTFRLLWPRLGFGFIACAKLTATACSHATGGVSACMLRDELRRRCFRVRARAIASGGAECAEYGAFMPATNGRESSESSVAWTPAGSAEAATRAEQWARWVPILPAAASSAPRTRSKHNTRVTRELSSSVPGVGDAGSCSRFHVAYLSQLMPAGDSHALDGSRGNPGPRQRTDWCADTGETSTASEIASMLPVDGGAYDGGSAAAVLLAWTLTCTKVSTHDSSALPVAAGDSDNNRSSWQVHIEVRSNAHAAMRTLRQNMSDFFDDVWGGLLELCAQPAPHASLHSDNTFARLSSAQCAYDSPEATRVAQARWAAMHNKSKRMRARMGAR